MSDLNSQCDKDAERLANAAESEAQILEGNTREGRSREVKEGHRGQRSAARREAAETEQQGVPDIQFNVRAHGVFPQPLPSNVEHALQRLHQ